MEKPAADDIDDDPNEKKASNSGCISSQTIQRLFVQHKVVMFLLGMASHAFRVYQRKFLLSSVGATEDDIPFCFAFFSFASLIISNACTFYAQKHACYLGTLRFICVVGCLCFVGIALLQNFYAKFLLYAAFVGFNDCIRPFSGGIMIKNLPADYLFAEQNAFMLLGSTATCKIYNYAKVPIERLGLLWSIYMVLLLVYGYVVVGKDFFDRGSNPKYATFSQKELKAKNEASAAALNAVADADSAPKNDVPPYAKGGFRAMLSNKNFRFLLYIAFVMGFASATYMHFTPSYYQQDLKLDDHQVSNLSTVGILSELVVGLSFRFLFKNTPPYTLFLVSSLLFVLRLAISIDAIAIFRYSSPKYAFVALVCAESLKGLIMGLMGAAVVRFFVWYVSPINKSIAFSLYNGIYISITGIVAGLVGGFLRRFLKGRFSDTVATNKLSYFACSNAPVLLLALVFATAAFLMIAFRFYLLKKGCRSDFGK